jgi:hypothetical protein
LICRDVRAYQNARTPKAKVFDPEILVSKFLIMLDNKVVNSEFSIVYEKQIL